MINPEVYSEVYEILKHMDKEIVMKIPVEILENIKNKRNFNYKSRINPNDIFNSNNVLPETIEVLNWIDVNFWISEDKKKKVLNLAREKQMEDDKLKKEKYNPDTIFIKKV